MKEKIDWYQEVLELEPGSKVFFPLAKLLVEVGRFDDAVRTLTHGLDRHPEYFEARLYLVDLLFSAGRVEQLRDHIDRLTPLLARYAGFWQAWSTMPPPDSGDTSVALAFLAHVFREGGVNLGQVIMRGLSAMEAPRSSNGARVAALDSEMSDAAAPAPDVNLGSLENIPPEESASEDTPLITKFVELEPEGGLTEDTSCEISEGVDAAAVGGMPEQGADTANEATIASTEGADAIAGNTGGKADSVSAGKVAGDDADDGEESEERFTLRTRSMAEVLAEQGDFGGALEIYQELLAAAESADAMADLQQRINTLTAHLHADQNASTAAPVQENSEVKDRVISVLEKLADRLDSRVH